MRTLVKNNYFELSLLAQPLFLMNVLVFYIYYQGNILKWKTYYHYYIN